MRVEYLPERGPLGAEPPLERPGREPQLGRHLPNGEPTGPDGLGQPGPNGVGRRRRLVHTHVAPAGERAECGVEGGVRRPHRPRPHPRVEAEAVLGGPAADRDPQDLGGFFRRRERSVGQLDVPDGALPHQPEPADEHRQRPLLGRGDVGRHRLDPHPHGPTIALDHEAERGRREPEESGERLDARPQRRRRGHEVVEEPERPERDGEPRPERERRLVVLVGRRLPQPREHFRGVGCERLTEALLVHPARSRHRVRVEPQRAEASEER